MLIYPDIDPIALQIGPIAVRWYALAYITGIVGGFYVIKYLNRKFTPTLLTSKMLDDLILWAVIGIILGGRLGYVLFYQTSYYLAHPIEIFFIWQGGMAFHGGMLGVVIAFYFFAQKYQIPFLRLIDYIAVVAPMGLFFGRIANFINGELYGRVTESRWGMVFPNGGPLPRHPSQLYEAALEGLALFVILFILIHIARIRNIAGVVAGVFLVGYGVFRFLVEFVRQPDAHLGLLGFGMSMGQWLCLPMILAGVIVIGYARHYARNAYQKPTV